VQWSWPGVGYRHKWEWRKDSSVLSRSNHSGNRPHDRAVVAGAADPINFAKDCPQKGIQQEISRLAPFQCVGTCFESRNVHSLVAECESWLSSFRVSNTRLLTIIYDSILGITSSGGP
jgi:hypothetical protein